MDIFARRVRGLGLRADGVPGNDPGSGRGAGFGFWLDLVFVQRYLNT
jgi:hypothetical protein